MSPTSVPSSAIPKETKDLFWRIVEECLIEFHHVPQPEANAKSMDLRARIESPPEEIMKKAFKDPGDYMEDIFYHNEPFHVACDIAGKELNLAKPEYSSLYDSILKKNDW